MDNIIEALLKQENIIPLFYLEKTKLNFKGIYLLMIKENSNLDEPFKTEIDNRKSNIFYLGKAERTLDERLQEECRGFRHGTFFRGVGALLNCKPPKG